MKRRHTIAALLLAVALTATAQAQTADTVTQMLATPAEQAEGITVVHNDQPPPAPPTRTAAPILKRTADPRNIRCHEQITRYVSGSLLDVIDASVSYEAGNEEYSKVQKNGRPMHGARELRQKRGAWTQYDFAQLLANLPEMIPFEIAGHVYQVRYAVEQDAHGAIVWSSIGDSLPPHVASTRLTLMPADNGAIATAGSFDVLYEDGTSYSNRMTWDSCQVYGAESRLTFTQQPKGEQNQ